MAETYITLNEAAELEAIGYETMKKRIHRNPDGFYHVMSGDFCDALSDHCKFRLQIKS